MDKRTTREVKDILRRYGVKTVRMDEAVLEISCLFDLMIRRRKLLRKRRLEIEQEISEEEMNDTNTVNETSQPATSPRCEGWRRYGGAFTLGPVRWEQCQEQGVVMIKFKDGGKVKTLPACLKCWQELQKSGAEIIETKVIEEEPHFVSKS